MFCLQKEVSKQSERVPFIFIVSVKLTKQCSFSHAYKKNCKWRMHMCLPFCGCNATPSQTSPSPPMVRLIGQITCRQACALFGGSLPNFRSQGGVFLLCGCKKIVLENVYHFFFVQYCRTHYYHICTSKAILLLSLLSRDMER